MSKSLPIARLGCCSYCAIVVAVLAVCIRVLVWWREAHGIGRPWALITMRPDISNPGTQFARYRGSERTEDNFMQWYYCLIHDSENQQSWSFAIGTFRKSTSGNPEAVVWLKTSVPYTEGRNFAEVLPEGIPSKGGLSRDGTRSSAVKSNTIVHAFPVENFHQLGDMDVSVKGIPQPKDNVTYSNEVTHSLKANSEKGEFHFQLNFPEDDSSVDVMFHRVYGFYGGDLVKNGSEYVSPPEKECNIENIPYGYDSEVSGTITINNRVYTFDQSPRFRGYIESTWSCMYPQGKGEVDYNGDFPWKWQWLVVPSSERSEFGKPNDIGLLFGWARLFHPPIGGSVTAAYITVDSPNLHISAKTAKLFATPNDSMPLPVDLEHSTTAREKSLISFETTHKDWDSSFEDEFGSAPIPKYQSIYLETEEHVVTVNYFSNIGSYVRIPVAYRDTNNKERICSDFRGTGGRTRLTIFAKTMVPASEQRNSRPLQCNAPIYKAIGRKEEHDKSTAEDMRMLAGNSTLFHRSCWDSEKLQKLEIIFDGEVPHNSIEFSYHAEIDEQ
eukprot:gb/GECG01003897.1/.p1 GENE.gb/GECG01003897.1/~~gb/GECG01003897.1/.p1  ORF type:complete len:555 (+),score=58.44 gb/GECG01003897.1/:1-1665(+)